MHFITPADETDFDEISAIWENSVRATHLFLHEPYIDTLKTQVREIYLPMVELYVCQSSSGEILGFIGVLNRKIEMLFVSPQYTRQGVGRSLIFFAIERLRVNAVDVNEQNADATLFYLRHGFQIIDRSERDAQGQPFPILHMKLSRNAKIERPQQPISERTPA